VPRDEGPGLHDGQSVAPIEPAAQQYQAQSGRIVGTSGLDLALFIERQLLTQKQILRGERVPGAQAETQKVNQITHNPQPTPAMRPPCNWPLSLSDVFVKSLRTGQVSSQSKCFCGAQVIACGAEEIARHTRSGGVDQLVEKHLSVINAAS